MMFLFDFFRIFAPQRTCSRALPEDFTPGFKDRQGMARDSHGAHHQVERSWVHFPGEVIRMIRIDGDFQLVMGYPNSWLVFVNGKIPLKWMMTRGTPTCGNHPYKNERRQWDMFKSHRRCSFTRFHSIHWVHCSDFVSSEENGKHTILTYNLLMMCKECYLVTCLI